MRKPRIIKYCKHCGEEFSVPPSLDRLMFCNKVCYDEYQTGDRKLVVCGSCGNEFKAKKDHGVWERFCNRACFESQQLGRKDVTCNECGKAFRADWKKDRDHYTKHCSRDCFIKAQTTRVPVNCFNCGKEFSPPRWKSDTHDEIFCSVKCHAAVKCGENSPAYKGGSYVASTGFRFVANGPHVAKVGYRGEHRLIVEKIIGRKLKYHSEPILHLNRDKTDNRPENMYVCQNMAEMGSILQGGQPFPQKSNIQNLSMTGKNTL